MDDIAELGCGTRTDVDPHPAVGDLHTDLADIAARFRFKQPPVRTHGGDVVGKMNRLRTVEEGLAGLDHVVLAQRRADVVSLRLQEGEAHAATDDQGIDVLEQGLDDRKLVADLRPAHDRHERTARPVVHPTEYLDFAVQETSGG